MRKIINEFFIIGLIVFVFFFAAINWALTPRCEGEGRRSENEYETNVLSEAFSFCGVNWEEMDETCETTNYRHWRNADIKHAIIIHKYDKRQPLSETDAYFIVGNGDRCWLITCEVVRDGGAGAYVWTAKEIDMEDGSAPASMLLRSMLIEYLEEILMEIPGGASPHQPPGGDVEKPKQGKGVKLHV